MLSPFRTYLHKFADWRIRPQLTAVLRVRRRHLVDELGHRGDDLRRGKWLSQKKAVRHAMRGPLIGNGASHVDHRHLRIQLPRALGNVPPCKLGLQIDVGGESAVSPVIAFKQSNGFFAGCHALPFESAAGQGVLDHFIEETIVFNDEDQQYRPLHVRSSNQAIEAVAKFTSEHKFLWRTTRVQNHFGKRFRGNSDSTRCSLYVNVLYGSSSLSEGETMTELASVRAEIDQVRTLVDRHRLDILALRRADISTADAELVLSLQLARLDGLIGERNRLTAAQRSPMQGKVLGAGVVRRFGTEPNPPPFLRALDTLRREATRQGDFPEHVATIIAIIDQHAKAATGNRHYFSDQPYSFAPGKPMQ